MTLYCDGTSHTWTTQTRTHNLTPALDLVPGRRCICGSYVIVDDDPRHTPGDSFAVASIDSIAADCWAATNPALKTW